MSYPDDYLYKNERPYNYAVRERLVIDDGQYLHRTRKSSSQREDDEYDSFLEAIKELQEEQLTNT